MHLSFAWERICVIDYIKLRTGNNTARRQNFWNLKPQAVSQHSHPALLLLFPSLALSCSPSHGRRQGWDFSRVETASRTVPWYQGSVPATEVLLRLDGQASWWAWIKSTRPWRGSECKRVGGHPRKPFWLSKRNSSKKAGTKCAKYRSQWNSLIKSDFKSSIQKLERKCIRGDKKEVWHRHIWPASNPVAGGQVEGLKRAAVESGEGEAYSLELMV